MPAGITVCVHVSSFYSIA